MAEHDVTGGGHADSRGSQFGEAGWGEGELAAGAKPARSSDTRGWRNPTAVLARRTGAIAADTLLLLLLANLVRDVLGWPFLSALLLMAGVIPVVLQGLTGLTPGKALLGLRTVRGDGRGPGIRACLVRTVLWVVDAAPWYVPLVGPLIAVRSIGHQRLGDMAADTFVVGARDAGRPVPMPWLANDVARLDEVYEFARANALRSQLGYERALSRTAAALVTGEQLVAMAAGRSHNFRWNALITVTDQRVIVVSQRRWRLFPSLNVENYPHGRISAVDRWEGTVWANVRLYTSSKTTEVHVWRGSAPGVVNAILDAKEAREATDPGRGSDRPR